jgi:predicted 2-oxoglutarate/Fe(II)-dependent dioxygenase YbiX
MAKTLIKHGNIFEWHEAFNDCEKVLELAKIGDWHHADVYRLDQDTVIVGRGLYVDQSYDVHESIKKTMLECLNEYILDNNLTVTEDHMDCDEFFFREYQPTSKFFVHEDWYGPRKLNGEDQRVFLSAILYFNENFTGGELNFPDNELCFQPKKGSVFIFPSRTMHEVLEIKSGNRYMTQTYVYELPISAYDTKPI